MRRFRGSKSSVYNHLLASPDCCGAYSDSSFTVLCRGRHGYGLQLKVLEAICCPCPFGTCVPLLAR